MVKLCIKLYAAGIITADNVASAIMPVSAAVIGVNWAWRGVTNGAVGGAQLFQLSSQSTGQFALNDARNILDEFLASADVAVTVDNCGANKFTMLPGIKVAAGDKLYLHSLVLQAFTTSQLNLNILLA
jgi:hypothetical protein